MNPTNTATPRVEAPQVQSPNAEAPQVFTPPVDLSQATALPSSTLQVDAAPTEPNVLAAAVTPSPAATPLPVMQVDDDGVSDSISYTSTLPDVFDVGIDDSAPPATGPWMIIDHFTGEVIVDDDQSTTPVPDISTVSTVPAGLSLPGVEIAIAPRLGTPYLVEIPPTLLSEDEDVRPQWLITAVNSFLRFVPCVGSLGKVIDLYLAQEARLGYPELVCAIVFFLVTLVLMSSSVHSPCTSISEPTH